MGDGIVPSSIQRRVSEHRQHRFAGDRRAIEHARRIPSTTPRLLGARGLSNSENSYRLIDALDFHHTFGAVDDLCIRHVQVLIKILVFGLAPSLAVCEFEDRVPVVESAYSASMLPFGNHA